MAYPVKMVDRTSGTDAELRDAIEALFFGYRAFTDRADRILARQGLGRVHHRILYFVGRNPGISVKGLLEILAVSKQAIHGPLRELVRLNLVAMTEDGADRRMKRLTLTAEGQALEVELTGAQMDHLARAFDAAGAGARSGWKAVMDRLASGR